MGETPREFDLSHPFASWFEVAKEATFKPQIFFSKMERAGGLKAPFIFLLLSTIPGSIAVGITVNPPIGGIVYFFSTLFIPLIGAQLFKFILEKLFQKKATYEYYFRIMAYASAPLVLGWLPFVSLFLEIIRWYLVYVALKEIFSLRSSQALISLVITLSIIFLLMAIFLSSGGVQKATK